MWPLLLRGALWLQYAPQGPSQLLGEESDDDSGTSRVPRRSQPEVGAGAHGSGNEAARHGASAAQPDGANLPLNQSTNGGAHRASDGRADAHAADSQQKPFAALDIESSGPRAAASGIDSSSKSNPASADAVRSHPLSSTAANPLSSTAPNSHYVQIQ